MQIRILVVNEKAPKYLRVSRSSLSIKPGQEFGVTVTAIYEKGYDEAVADDVEWTTADADIATVKNGVVTGTAKGKTKITASYGGKTVTLSVTVR